MQINVERKNVMYGDLNPDVNNVYFTHGLIDPWRTMGIQYDLNAYSPADVIPGTLNECPNMKFCSQNYF